MSFLLFQIPRACGLNFICKITHVTQINVKWFVFIFSAIIKCRFKRVPVDFGPALEFRLTRAYPDEKEFKSLHRKRRQIQLLKEGLFDPCLFPFFYFFRL